MSNDKQSPEIIKSIIITDANVNLVRINISPRSRIFGKTITGHNNGNKMHLNVKYQFGCTLENIIGLALGQISTLVRNGVDTMVKTLMTDEQKTEGRRKQFDFMSQVGYSVKMEHTPRVTAQSTPDDVVAERGLEGAMIFYHQLRKKMKDGGLTDAQIDEMMDA